MSTASTPRKQLFVITAEIAVDVGQHIIAAEGLSAPRTFAEVFHNLGGSGWLPDELATTFADIARFWNLLVHGYAEVDDDRVVAILHERLDDLTALGRHVAQVVLDDQ